MTKIFCAVDTTSRDRAVDLVTQLTGRNGEEGLGFKLGLEFFAAHGPEGIRDLRRMARDAKMFLDLKLHDIPNTVAGAVRAVVHCEADFLTVHTSGGLEMMKAAVQAAAEEEQKTGYAAPKILGVTVLTSLDESALSSVGQGSVAADQVLRLAKLAKEAGLAGLVCSPKEIALLRKEVKDMMLVVPGIRPAGSDTGDQKRVMTPEEAVKAGADWLVIGRPITEAKDPGAAARGILQSMRALAA
jgi:orotidine-5'-phosphate decarboxylase